MPFYEVDFWLAIFYIKFIFNWFFEILYISIVKRTKYDKNFKLFLIVFQCINSFVWEIESSLSKLFGCLEKDFITMKNKNTRDIFCVIFECPTNRIYLIAFLKKENLHKIIFESYTFLLQQSYRKINAPMHVSEAPKI